MKPCGNDEPVLFRVTVNLSFGRVMPKVIYIPVT